MKWIASLALLPVTVMAAAPPNIVLPYADDMGFGDLRANPPELKIPRPFARAGCHRRARSMGA